MPSIYLFVAAAFAVATILGYFAYRSHGWNYVDLVYYPLAAIGVVLLFAANEAQRTLIAVNAAVESAQTALEKIQLTRPSVDLQGTEAAFDLSLQSIKVVHDFASVCSRSPSRATGECLAAAKFGAPTTAFLSIATAAYPNFADRLLASCAAADTLIQGLSTDDRLTSLVVDPMASIYRDAVTSHRSLVADALLFKEKVQAEIDKVQKLAFEPNDPAGTLLRARRYQEAALAQLILFGVSTCTTAPRQQLADLESWKVATRTKQQHIEELERQRLALRVQTVSESAVGWIQLNLWPFVLIAGLSLKFGKGIAAVRKAMPDRSSATKCGGASNKSGSIPP